MELTKKDVKHIEDEVRKLSLRIEIEATEYAKLYEVEYLNRLRDEIDAKIEVVKFVQGRTIEIANEQT